MATLDELKDGLNAEFSSRLLGGRPVVENSNIDVIAGVIAFQQFACEKSIEFLSQHITPSTAVGSILDGWGQSFGVFRRQETSAQGRVTFTGTPGSTIPAGTLITGCNGVDFTTDQDFTFVSNQLSIPVTATQTGPEGNLGVGQVLSVGAVVPGLASEAISQGLVGGSDIECDDDYRQRLLSAVRTPCRTGTCDDYDFWVREYPGVSRVCCVPKAEGPGTIKIYFMMDDVYPNGIPTVQDVDAVQEIIFGTPGEPAPIGICGTVCSPTLREVDICLSGVGTITDEEYDEILLNIQQTMFESFDCDESSLCITDILVNLKGIRTECINIDKPVNDIYLPAGTIPVLGELMVT